MDMGAVGTNSTYVHRKKMMRSLMIKSYQNIKGGLKRDETRLTEGGLVEDLHRERSRAPLCQPRADASSRQAVKGSRDYEM